MSPYTTGLLIFLLGNLCGFYWAALYYHGDYWRRRMDSLQGGNESMNLPDEPL